MPRGPLPKPEGQRRRRNAPTIAGAKTTTTNKRSMVPDIPDTVKLRKAGLLWWKWAWTTPQAKLWNEGHVDAVARRAALQDDLAATEEIHGLDLSALPTDARATVRSVASIATGRLNLYRHMLDLDRQLGLTPKAQADLRWSIEQGGEPAEEDGAGDVVTGRWATA